MASRKENSSSQKDVLINLQVNKEGSHDQYNPPATEPQKDSIDDTMRNIAKQQKPQIISPEVASFSNMIQKDNNNQEQAQAQNAGP